jgi:hypothetical protein
MATRSGAISALVAPDLRKVYVDTGKERPLEYPLFHNTSDLEWNPATDQQVSGLGTLPGKDEGEQFTLDEILMGGTKTYTAEPFGLAVEITWEAWRDELYGVMREMVRELARASRNRQEVSAWSVLNNAFSTSFVGSQPLTLALTGLPAQTVPARTSRFPKPVFRTQSLGLKT